MEQSHFACAGTRRATRWTLGQILLHACLFASTFAVLSCATAETVISHPGTAATAVQSVVEATVAQPIPAPKAREPEGLSRLATFLAKKYRVSAEATSELVSTSYSAGKEVGLDPLLILAVIGVESRFNPFAEAASGAKGLMQIIPKYHMEKFTELGGKVLDPKTNILVGAKILKEYMTNTGGSLMDALKLYGGGPTSVAGQEYAGKVLAEKQRMQQVLRTRRDPS